MKKIVAIVVMMILTVGLVFANGQKDEPKRLVDQYSYWDFVGYDSMPWDTPDLQETINIYKPMIGQDYTKECMDGPVTIEYLSEKAGEVLEDTEYCDTASFTVVRGRKRYLIQFLEFESGEFYMIAFKDEYGAYRNYTLDAKSIASADELHQLLDELLEEEFHADLEYTPMNWQDSTITVFVKFTYN